MASINKIHFRYTDKKIFSMKVLPTTNACNPSDTKTYKLIIPQAKLRKKMAMNDIIIVAKTNPMIQYFTSGNTY